MSAAYWWIVLLTYCHVGPVNFHIVSEPDFPNLDFPWSVWEVMLHVSHLAENIRSVSPMMCDRTPNVELFSCSVTVPLSFHLSTLALSLCVPCWLCLSAWFCHLSIIFSVSFSLVWSPWLPHLNYFCFPSMLSLPLFFPCSFSSDTIILSPQNWSLPSIPYGLTYITHFTGCCVIKDCIQLVTPRAESSMYLSPRSGQTWIAHLNSFWGCASIGYFGMPSFFASPSGPGVAFRLHCMLTKGKRRPVIRLAG